MEAKEINRLKIILAEKKTNKWCTINLKSYIIADSRHKLLFVKNEVNGVEFVDIGKQLSAVLESSLQKKRLPLLADDGLEKIISDNTIHDSEIGDYVALKNIGILFEPQLQFNLHIKFDSWAKTKVLIVQMEGIIQDNRFYLAGCTDSKYSINLKDITFKTIYDEI